MPANHDESNQPKLTRHMRLSRGHNPPKHVEDEVPTLPQRLFGDGGPSKPGFKQSGTNPWIAGSLTVGSNKVFVVDFWDFNTSSPNVWWKLRHNHPGSASIPGGTIKTWHQPARGNLSPDAPGAPYGFFSIRGPGTLFLYGMGAGSQSAGSSGLSSSQHRSLGTRAIDRFSGLVVGHII